MIYFIRKESNRKELNKMKFWGRVKEQNKLQKMLSKKQQQLALVYGRRRVGKSELIKQCLRDSSLKSIYYECKQTTEMNNVESLAELLAEAFNYPPLAFKNIEAVLNFFFKQAQHMPLILVLDEYPYLREAVKGMDSILQGLVDKYQESSQLKLIICGSYVDIMKSLLLVQNPLYGRVSLTIDLKPMNYRDSALFYSSFNDEDKVRLYSVFGGIPYYNRLIDAEKTVKENIIDLIASPGARLETEIGLYLRSELAKITNANEVFETLAKGFFRYSDILAQSHISSGPTLIDVLERLMKMELVSKIAPINDEKNKKKTGYYISDNLSLFYYKYIFRYMSQMNVMQPEVFFERYIEQDFETDYVPHIFEDVCRQYLVEKNQQGLLEEPFEKIGRYYYDDSVNKTNGEFDIVTYDAKGYAFYEAKFRKKPVTQQMIQEEIEQVQRSNMLCYKYGFFSRSGFENIKLKGVELIGLEALYR